ncbi:MAG TPA: ferrochelatase [Propionibacteriaceae bacterium]|nr:ferrochelatase [Propionibacteriaceae bacterium]
MSDPVEPPASAPSRSSRSRSTAASDTGLDPYDAVVLVSFGGPEKPDDVMPFLENVTRGRGIPRERLEKVAEHYLLFGGRSPINDQCRMLLAALAGELADRSIAVPLYWGNRNWDPYLFDAFAQMHADGHRRVLALMTSAYPSYSSCRQYRENLYDAAEGTSIRVDRLRHYAHHPSFVAASVKATSAALEELGEAADGARLVFVTHSIPIPMAQTAGPPPKSADGGYVDWHEAVQQAVTAEVNRLRGASYESDLVYCSRSGPPAQPWLEPDVNDHLRDLAEQGVRSVVTVPIGFISDHLEVIFDLDTEARQTAADLGIQFARAATAGTDPAFVSGLVDLLLERARAARGSLIEPPVMPGGTVGRYECLPNCCPNLRQLDRPALCQSRSAL